MWVWYRVSWATLWGAVSQKPCLRVGGMVSWRGGFWGAVSPGDPVSQGGGQCLGDSVWVTMSLGAPCCRVGGPCPGALSLEGLCLR